MRESQNARAMHRRQTPRGNTKPPQQNDCKPYETVQATKATVLPETTGGLFVWLGRPEGTNIGWSVACYECSSFVERVLFHRLCYFVGSADNINKAMDMIVLRLFR